MKAKALLLAGGLGTRLRPLTETTPKCLVKIDEQPLLGFWIDNLLQAGISEATINTHHLPEPVRDYIQHVKAQYGFVMHESYEPELLGSAGTVSANINLADDVDCVVLIYADNLSDVSLAKLIQFHASHTDPITMLLFHAENPSACGIATLDEQQRIIDFVEKPQNPSSDLANAGIYVIDAETYREIANLQRFDFGHDVLPDYAGKMRGFDHNGYHRDIGTLDSLEQARSDLAEGRFKPVKHS